MRILVAISVPSGVGTFIAYATQPGNVARDGDGRNSPFTGPFKLHITKPGVSLSDLMILVRNEVVASTNGLQVPWDNSALLGKFYFKEGPATESEMPVSSSGAAAEAWSWIKNTTDFAILEEFIRRYGDSTFGAAAKKQRADLRLRQAGAQAQVIPNLKAISLAPMQPSYDCKVHYKDAEVTICNNPELSILDNELDRLYSQTSKRLFAAQRRLLIAEQRQWVEARDFVQPTFIV